jgi:hypothetical protein
MDQIEGRRIEAVPYQGIHLIKEEKRYTMR